MRPHVTLLAALVSCTPAQEPEPETPESTYNVRGPDGTTNWQIVRCGATEECYLTAARTCPQGFSVYDRDKNATWESDTASVTSTGHGLAVAARPGLPVMLGAGGNVSAGVSSTNARPIPHGEMLVKCGASEHSDAKLFDQLKAYCDDGNAKACEALDFATKKRGCCTWHQGARRCSETGHVVCFDGTENDAPTCGCP